MGKGHNLVSVILYDERRIRPDTLKNIRDAVDAGINGALIPADAASIDAFKQLIFFQPEIERLDDERSGRRENQAQKKKRLLAEQSQRAIDESVS